MVLKGFFININMKPKIKVNGPQGVVELFTESSLVGKLPAQKQPKIVFRKFSCLKKDFSPNFS